MLRAYDATQSTNVKCQLIAENQVKTRLGSLQPSTKANQLSSKRCKVLPLSQAVLMVELLSWNIKPHCCNYCFKSATVLAQVMEHTTS